MENSPAPVELAIAHVLFMDIVGYSRLTTKEQNAAVATLNEIVQSCDPFQAAEKANRLLKIPTGDGMALVFYSSAEEPVQCAVAVSRALKEHPKLGVRMGVHSGSVSGIVDVSGRANVAGAGINIGQRVMDCADAGHILLSKHAADDLAEYERWRPMLHDLGPCEVKHGAKVHVVNLWDETVGNSRIPTRLRTQQARIRRRRLLWLGLSCALLATIALGLLLWRSREKARASNLSHSVAVLPFESLSTDPDNAILAGGVHREILTNLAKVADLRVISRTSVMKYKPGGDRNLKKIADELGVSYLVEGSVQRAGDRVKVTAELVNAATDSSVWAQTYDGEAKDVLTFQTEIAERVSNQLGAVLSPRERAELGSKLTHDLAAYESYIRARALMEAPELEGEHDKFVEDNKEALRLLEQAIARDPKFAAARCALVEANLQLFRSDNVDPDRYRSAAEVALRQAERLAPEAGETILAEARFIYYGENNFAKALARLEQAAKLLPNNAEVTLTRGLLYRRFGRWSEAWDQLVRVTELNPQEASGYDMAAGAAEGLRWWPEYDEMLHRVAKKFPSRARMARAAEAVSLRFRGDVDAGNRILESLHLDVRSGFSPLFYMATWRHDFDEARRLVTEAAKYPDLVPDRWDKELQLVFLKQMAPSTAAAVDAEQRAEEQLTHGTAGTAAEITATLCEIKLILGKNDEAIRLAEEAVAKHPLSEDALGNAGYLKWLARAYMYAGDRERAIQTFAKTVQLPAMEYYGPLKYDPLFDGLRQDPRFQAIVEQSKVPFPR